VSHVGRRVPSGWQRRRRRLLAAALLLPLLSLLLWVAQWRPVDDGGTPLAAAGGVVARLAPLLDPRLPVAREETVTATALLPATLQVHTPLPPVPVAEDAVSVYLVALGDVPCQTAHLEAALWSLWTAGAWSGRVHVATDRPDCVRLDAVWQALEGHPTTRPGPLVLHAVRPRAGMPLTAIEMKQWKMRAYEMVPTTPPYVLCVDVDAFIRAPLTAFLDVALAALYDAAATPHMLASPLAALCAPAGTPPDQYAAAGLGMQRERCHSGVLLLHRDISRACLAAWLDALADNSTSAQGAPRYARDQAALEHLLDTGHCHAAALAPSVWMTFPDTSSPAAVMADVARARTFLHITRTYRLLKLQRQGISLAAVLGLPSTLSTLHKPPRTD
jgi:hypothetical protein